jgi:hypothetical protein
MAGEVMQPYPDNPMHVGTVCTCKARVIGAIILSNPRSATLRIRYGTVDRHNDGQGMRFALLPDRRLPNARNMRKLGETANLNEGSVVDDNDGVSQGNEFSGTVGGSSVQARSIYGGVRFDIWSQSSVPPPAQLRPPAFFAGRQKELDDLRLALRAGAAGELRLVVITGAGGIGKTALGLHWLNQIRDDYKDGQLFADLRGFSGGGPPMSSSEVLGRFLRALGHGTKHISPDLDERASMFRSLTTGRRMIIMLDNAASTYQVRPLLPGPGPALVMVTTRQRLPGLTVEGAHVLRLTSLDETGAWELLSRMVGRERMAAEPDAARSLVSLCGGLPLAVCASGVRLAARHRLRIAHVVDELADDTRRLSTLSVEPDISLRATLDLSYRALPHTVARLYRLLSVHPGPDFDATAATALAGLKKDDAAGLLDLLVDASLLEEEPYGRFRFLDLIRLHAREKLRETE